MVDRIQEKVSHTSREFIISSHTRTRNISPFDFELSEEEERLDSIPTFTFN